MIKPTSTTPRLSPRRHLVWLTALVALAPLMAACSTASHIDSEVAHQYRSSVELGAVGRGWKQVWVGRLIDEPRVIQHKVEIQADLVGELVRMSGRELRKTVGPRICPAADHGIWQQLESGHDIEIELATKKNGPFATVSCRSAVL